MRSGGGQWRLLFTGHGSGAWNMAVDEAMMLLHAQGKIPPTIRFYQLGAARRFFGVLSELAKGNR
ncbi:MAG: hypothetical protein M1553_13385 [Firmicutes bacterium]|nr:hypothetical protein [Bacillota bacterium]